MKHLTVIAMIIIIMMSCKKEDNTIQYNKDYYILSISTDGRDCSLIINNDTIHFDYSYYYRVSLETKPSFIMNGCSGQYIRFSLYINDTYIPNAANNGTTISTLDSIYYDTITLIPDNNYKATYSNEC